ncbi:hypothetical protein KR018_010249, partial [Drosophila ironensis]
APKIPNVEPLITYGNVSSNPFVNALERVENLDNRIVGGHRMTCDLVPFQCSLHYEEVLTCGSVLLNRFWLLCAHHCIFGPVKKYTVRCGTMQQKRYGQKRNVAKIVVNKEYNSYTMRHDLSLIKVKSAFILGYCLWPVKLASPEITHFPKEFLVSGWGITSVNAWKAQKYCLGTYVDLVRRGKCQKDYKGTGVKIYKDMICASRRGKDSCSGDSGGPLTNNSVLYGIVSFGIGCANKKYPGVYVNVKRYIPWI